MADTRIGKIGLTPKGAWVSTDSYEILDVVISAVEDGGDGCSYTALKPSQGVRPGTDSTIWLKSSQAGQSIYDLAVKYHHFEGTEEEFEAEYQAALQAARDAAAGASAVESQVEEAEAARVAAENARVSAEAARGDAETARQNAETSRSTAETARQSAESNRGSAETTRQSAETTRESAETTRQSNESARASAELTRTQQFQALQTDMQTAIQNVDAKAAEIAEDIEGYERNEAGRVSAEQGRVAAETARAQQSASDHTRAESDHTTATSDHQQAGSDHTRAEADHTTASEDHTTAASDHSTAGTDHTRAEQDHTTAESDHGTAESDHTRAESDHAIVQGYDTRLTNVEGEVSQLGQDLDEDKISKSFGVNLFDKTTSKEGYLINASGNEEANESYNASDYIPVDAEVTYYKSTDMAHIPFRYVNYYNSNKQHIGTRSSDVSSFTTPANCAYVRVTFYAHTSYNYAQVSKQDTTFIPFTPIAGFPADTLQDNVVATAKLQNKAVTVPKLGDDVPTFIDEKISRVASGLVKKTYGKNLYDPSAATLSAYLDASGNIVTGSDSYNTSGFIPVESGETYSKSIEMNVFPFRFVCFYDSSKALVGSRLGDQNNFTVPSGASFVRISFYANASYAYAQVTKSSTQEAYTPYTPIGGYIAEQLLDGIVSANKIQTKAVTLPKLGDDITSKLSLIESKLLYNVEDDNGTNLVNPSEINDGYWNMEEVSSSSYKYVHLDISALVAGTTLSFLWSNGDTASARFVQFYKGTTNKSTHNVQNVSSATIPDDVDSVYISFGSYRLNHNYEVGVFNSANPEWEQFAHITKAKWTRTPSKPQALVRFTDLNGHIPNDVLKGKKWCPLGDSFTQGVLNTTFDSGIYAGKNKVYPYYIGNRTGINVVNTFFQGGRTLAFPASPGDFTNSICNPSAACYYQNIPADTDYITIYLGINDSHHAPGSGGGDREDNTGEIPIGTIDDATTATYYGAWNVVLSWLIENRPFAHIGIIVSNGCDTAEYRTAQIAVARKHGIPFIDLNGDDRTPFMIRSMNTTIPSAIRTKRTQAQAADYPTNTHPNDAAHEFESYFIEAFLKSI